MKPFDLQAALSGEAVMLRNGSKAFVRHHETELWVTDGFKLLGYAESGQHLSWSEDGNYYGSHPFSSCDDIIGMYPGTRVINGFEVPAPETEPLELGSKYYIVSLTQTHFYSWMHWDGVTMEHHWLSRGLVFLNKEDAIATAKAMLGIDPHNPD